MSFTFRTYARVWLEACSDNAVASLLRCPAFLVSQNFESSCVCTTAKSGAGPANRRINGALLHPTFLAPHIFHPLGMEQALESDAPAVLSCTASELRASMLVFQDAAAEGALQHASHKPQSQDC